MADWDDLDDKQAKFVMHYTGYCRDIDGNSDRSKCYSSSTCMLKKYNAERAAGYDKPQTDLLKPGSPTYEMIQTIFADRLPPKEAIMWKIGYHILHNKPSLQQRVKGADCYHKHYSKQGGGSEDLSDMFGLNMDDQKGDDTEEND